MLLIVELSLEVLFLEVLFFYEYDKIDLLLFKRVLVALSRMETYNNRKMSLDDCLNGTRVTPQNVVVGAKISGRGIAPGSEITWKYESNVPQNPQCAGLYYFAHPGNWLDVLDLLHVSEWFIYQCK